MTGETNSEDVSTVERALPLLRLDLVSLFPSIFDGWLQQGVVARAAERGIIEVSVVDLRPFGVGRHRITDDYPFGGGVGMVMKPEPVFDAVESLGPESGTPIILLSPRGRVLTQQVASDLSRNRRLVLLSGHYEGVDERVRQHLVTDEISVGDYVLSCGELASMVTADAVVRLLPGALSEGATEEESFSAGLLEYPQFTRPPEFRGWTVPEVLLSGHHAEIARWRRRQALLVTRAGRPDLIERAPLSEADRAVLAGWEDACAGLSVRPGGARDGAGQSAES